ncbi:PTS glucose transporter subunit IIBC [Photobacterium jeanii]|uniref:PTS glucose transporter subunit IIBC n=1 Tax=Photobacterium jeanii TaxID=858640 RepID=A0A178KAK7_9GAMM|nr:N-acetylglucosamine-specific PTS transporter subunit IIBC [Photobacterium jeanii]OAN13712.1 PTS glucose transporter subunit IIBC [Photobacterium jeanii]PST88833.1 PTS glucose transporter subunit IIBC [Photobacterium jeanii]
MNILGYLQRVGQALMAPIAALPAAAILMGIGYWIDPVTWGANNAFAAFLIKSGAAIIDNMPILFAIGIAFGMSKDRDGAAALAGFVCFTIVMALLSPSAMSLIQGVDADQVSMAFGKINNQFVGIIVGVISAEIYNRYSGVEMPKAMAFFSGKRLVPILTAFAGIVISAVFMVIWPPLFSGLTSFGEWMQGLGSAGAGLYGFFNRLLIPVGLHHGLNPVFWFDIAGINDIPHFLGGAKSIAEGTGIPGVTGMYLAGFFPVMMFGLPGAALAMYVTSKSENKDKVASVMLAASFSAFFTGITEPLEFAFMFMAPALYLVHAIFTGLSLYIAASMQWISGFGFSAGLVDMVLASKNPLAVNWYMLIVQGVVFFALYFVVFRFAILKWNITTPGREESESNTQSVAKNSVTKAQTDEELAHQFATALGGRQNLVTIGACITRLRLTLQDGTQVDEASLKALGAAAVVRVGKNNVQVILGAKAEKVANVLSRLPAAS